MPAFWSVQSKCKKPQNISPLISCLFTECNCPCGLETKPEKEAVISKQHNTRETFNVATGYWCARRSTKEWKSCPAVMRPLWIQLVCGKGHHYVVWNRICVTRRRKEGKSGQLRGQTIESRDFSYLRAWIRKNVPKNGEDTEYQDLSEEKTTMCEH